jgi:sterol desaturase/sphingolipid hydroxylase (fatty acid hydroxylase superfamily)
MENVGSGLATALFLLLMLAAVAGLERLLPLHRRSADRAHLTSNLSLTLLTFATNLLLNLAFAGVLLWLGEARFGLLHRLSLPPAWELCIALLGLDLATYAGHVAMHRLPSFWRFHRVHHCDPAVDVTTSLRQHPGEGGIRYAFLAAASVALGVGPVAFALYRLASVLCALLEHANLRVPLWLDRGLSWVFTFPGVHKIHHSRDPRLSDTNYGNLVSWWDRLFRTYTPVRHARGVRYGLDGLDDERTQSSLGLLALPFRPGPGYPVRRASPRSLHAPILPPDPGSAAAFPARRSDRRASGRRRSGGPGAG